MLVAFTHHSHRWQTDGKFFRCGSTRLREILAVTYGPFPPQHPAHWHQDFSRITNCGFNAIRIYDLPSRALLDAAHDHGLKVMGTLPWEQHADFLQRPSRLSAARVRLAEGLRAVADHPSLAAVYVGNEIPPDLVRWMGPARVLDAIESLIDLGRLIAPEVLFAYANYPSTEYLEPGNADFSAFNIYLENPECLRAYLKRLHHIAGDRPLVVSEFGLDSRSCGTERQASLLPAAIQVAREEAVTGFTIYAWSDRWFNRGEEILDWDFGLTDRDGHDKPALFTVSEALQTHAAVDASPELHSSVIVCTRNGRERIGRCLDAIHRQQVVCFQTIVVDDGSSDGTADWIAEHHPWVELLRLPASGLSAARNAGAAAARGHLLAFTDDDCEPDAEWLKRLQEYLLQHPDVAACGGPNLPQQPKSWQEAVVCAAPGAASHVMLDDEHAEHLPGCNLVVRKSAFESIGGFDPQFHTAGDDVDFCWRLQDAGHTLGFVPAAFVWHWRRPTLQAFLKQQIGYGKAERLLIAKHPSRFTNEGDAKWQGFIYSGGPIRATSESIIYHGAMGMAGYQSVTAHMQPLRDLPATFRDWRSLTALEWLQTASALLRGWFRVRRLKWPQRRRSKRHLHAEELDFGNVSRDTLLRALLQHGWQPCDASDPWDLEKDGTRLMVASEHGPRGQQRTLVRLTGSASLLPAGIVD